MTASRNMDADPPSRPRLIFDQLERRPFYVWEWLPGLALLIVVLVWEIKGTFFFNNAADFGLAYNAGLVALQNGHPESLWYWTGDPFLAMFMAGVARLLSPAQATFGINIVNLSLILGLLGSTWWQLRSYVELPVWWLTLAAAALYAPLMSAAWWKQFEILSLALAAIGFMLIRGSRGRWGGLFIAISISMKPLVLLLPLALLVRRDTRRAGLLTILWLVLLNGLAQVFMAWRARSLSALSPLIFLHSFSSKSAPPNPVPCFAINYSPNSLICRLVGMQHFTTQRAIVYGLVLLLILLALRALQLESGRSWAFFSFALLLSPMASPIEWSHYQVLLAPIFLMLACTYSRAKASFGEWLTLAAAYVLCELTLDPFGTLPGAVTWYLTGQPETQADITFWISIAQFAQYVLFALAFAWFINLRARYIVIDTPAYEGPTASAHRARTESVAARKDGPNEPANP